MKHSLAETDLCVGDRIRVVDILEDPIPPAIGATGTIIADASDDGTPKARIRWDQPGLWVATLIFPEDRDCVTVIPESCRVT